MSCHLNTNPCEQCELVGTEISYYSNTQDFTKRNQKGPVVLKRNGKHFQNIFQFN